MEARGIKKVCFFGGYVEDYPRNNVLRKGLLKNDVEVCVCRTSPRRRLLSRYAVLLYRYFRMKRDFEVILVPEFRHKDVPLEGEVYVTTGGFTEALAKREMRRAAKRPTRSRERGGAVIRSQEPPARPVAAKHGNLKIEELESRIMAGEEKARGCRKVPVAQVSRESRSSDLA